MRKLFAKLVEDLTTLTDDELNESLAGHRDALKKIQAQDPEFLADLTADDISAQLAAGAAEYKALKAELASRTEAETTFTSHVDDVVNEALSGEETEEAETSAEGDDDSTDGDDSGDGDGEGGEPEATAEAGAETPEVEAPETPEVTGEAEAPAEVTASGKETLTQRRLRRPAKAPARSLPIAVNEAGPSRTTEDGLKVGELLASGGFADIVPGTALSRKELATALLDAHRVTHARNGASVEVVVASARTDYPEDRVLRSEDPLGNLDKVAAAVYQSWQPEEVLASGGLCAPLTPIYDLPLLAVQDRPVRASLPTFQADRGGITFPTPLTLADVANAVTYVTAEDDAAGGSLATKSCLELDCDAFLSAEIAAIAACTTWGNMGSRAWPERVANVAELTAAYHAKVAETAILDAFGDPANSTAVTDEAVYGAVASLFQGILKAAAAYRSRNRMRRDATLNVYLPQWVPDMLAADTIESQFDRFRAESAIVSYLGQANVTPTWYMDSETGEDMVFDAQAAGAIDEFPTTVVWYLFAPGTWLFLDMGRLDLGIVRDSILNAVNDFQVFWETFEGAAKVGLESIKVTSTVCVNGSTSGPDTIVDCS